ncbi:hypothetical protein GCM10011415_33840 [Salipiger pallidus]|uniref:Uncharacterized protein n=1 Tax=Salipiger pallidus TaxID=1775170 RepID=A0A8J2ZMA4_9RHOB|nr:hypothetical protein [Salipiger pallidus]GGG81505.1 hypothetical protein GCM10011415_33840 [Salipiger pallidus]
MKVNTARMALLAAGIAAATTGTAQAQGARACAPRDQVVSKLTEKYGETRQSIGLGSNNAMMEVYASSETGTWTITVTSAGGMTCLVASGQAYEMLEEALAKPESDA